jgi:hypothetical protein
MVEVEVRVAQLHLVAFLWPVVEVVSAHSTWWIRPAHIGYQEVWEAQEQQLLVRVLVVVDDSHIMEQAWAQVAQTRLVRAIQVMWELWELSSLKNLEQ